MPEVRGADFLSELHAGNWNVNRRWGRGISGARDNGTANAQTWHAGEVRVRRGLFCDGSQRVVPLLEVRQMQQTVSGDYRTQSASIDCDTVMREYTEAEEWEAQCRIQQRTMAAFAKMIPVAGRIVADYIADSLSKHIQKCVIEAMNNVSQKHRNRKTRRSPSKDGK